jgi:hypothetical protein
VSPELVLAGLPELAVPEDLEVRRISTVDDLRAADAIDLAVFGGGPADEAALAASAARLDDEHRVLLRDGSPVGSAGLVLAGDTLRLWGAAVLPQARHSGVYRGLLDHRQYGEVRAYRLARG